ncbi:DNA helicase RecQ [Haematospirillum sp. 15-248]|uniref:DNA helicase RecQ n=1 Tax=Haematospirillum sp. 15-248 TaxID=2723107 RepID=UPI00143C0EE3|nr:DNA helicase RecQ [Haematospirillum sp. 15-248]NKD87605.1 DNA helicase RecQ [Haematospirillum sp. 15-248]
MRADPLHILKTVFGYEQFRGHQRAVIDHVVAGGDAMVLMPTGGGKSLCYQIPALCRDGIAIVVSPLIALMQNQVEMLRQLGVKAAGLHSGMSFSEIVETGRSMRAGELDMLYVAPERLMQPAFLDQLHHCRLALFAIDEAHCVSQWGHDFRPEYLQLAALAERFPGVPRLALTATADQPTRLEILEQLCLGKGAQFIAGFDRPNIRYRVSLKNAPKKQLLHFIRTEHSRNSGIVYCLSRAKVEETASWLREQGIQALAYHAGLDRHVRHANQDKFLREDGLVMVATIAFGMGIDKPDVRFVAHLDLPRSLEAYYQETGRAGRDGLPSDAWMVYGLQDAAKIRQMIEASDASESKKAVERQKVSALLGYCETTCCRRQVLLGYFGDSASPCNNCDTCLQPVDTFDGLEAAQQALSAIYRTGQRFGVAYIVDVLRGEENDRIRDMGHQHLSTFGIGRSRSANEWKSILRQLIAMGHAIAAPDQNGALILGHDVLPVLRGEARVSFRRDPVEQRSATGKRVLIETPAEQILFDALRARRLELARAQGVPPYVIFHDATLLEMARRKPVHLDSLSKVPGVGCGKLGRYGQDFLDVIIRGSEPDTGPEIT